MKSLLTIVFVFTACIAFATEYDWIWAKSLGSAEGNDKSYQSETDASGNVYVTGDYSSIASFGAYNLLPYSASTTETDIFLAKYAPDGTCLWVRRAGSSWWDHSFGLCLDSFGNVWIGGVVTGYGIYSSTYTYFGESPFALPYGYVVFVAKYAADGTFLGKATSSAANNPSLPAVINDLDADDAGNVYAIGYYYDTLSFGSQVMTAQNASYACFVAKLDGSLNWTWVSQLDLPGTDVGSRLKFDPEGIFVTGSSYGGGIFNGVSIPAQGAYDLFAAKLDHAGAWQWAKFFGSAGQDNGMGICTDGNGKAMVSGVISGSCDLGGVVINPGGVKNGFILALDEAGNTLWAKKVGSNTQSSAVSVTRSGDLYAVTGEFINGWSYDSLSSQTGSGIYLLGFDSSGAGLWFERVDHAAPLSPAFIYLDGAKSAYIGGAYSGSLSFATHQTNSSGLNDGYIARISPRVEVLLEIISLSPGELTLTWQNVSGAIAYRIYRSNEPDGEWELSTQTDGSSNFYHLGSPELSRGFFKVTAILP